MSGQRLGGLKGLRDMLLAFKNLFCSAMTNHTPFNVTLKKYAIIKIIGKKYIPAYSTGT